MDTFDGLSETEQERMLREQEEGLAPAWYQVSDYWKWHAQKLMDRYNEFEQLRSWLAANPVDSTKYPELAADRAELLASAQNVQARVAGTINTIRNAWSWLRGATGLDGVEAARHLAGLGAIPLIPIAVITGGAALIGKWISDAYMLSRRLAEIKRLEAQGMSPQDAARTVAQTMPKGFFERAGSWLVPLAIAGAVLFVGFMNQRSR